jgi:stage II sporulation protein R
MNGRNLRRWEAALMMAFALALTAGVWASASQSALADRVVRLHVVANSDSDRDQAVKLLVRDAVLAQATPLLDGVDSRQGAEAALAAHLDQLAQAGAEALARAGVDDPVTVTLEDQWFPTKVYDGFSLPAGQYRALRVVIGDGAGQNWWCVVFPPLCLASVTEEVAQTAMAGGLTDDQISLITGQDGGYVLKFKLVEWWEKLFH